MMNKCHSFHNFDIFFYKKKLHILTTISIYTYQIFSVLILAKVFAVAGAISRRSAHKPSSTWLFHCAFSSSSLVNVEKTSFLESVESVSGVIKSLAAGVITTFTSAPDLTKSRTIQAVL